MRYPMPTCSALLLSVVVQLSCVSASHRGPASTEATKFDGFYEMAAARCAVAYDNTQVPADMFALREAQKIGQFDVETGHSRLTAGAGTSLRIGNGAYTFAMRSACTVQSRGELEARGDDAILHRTSAQSCTGETVNVTDRPEANLSQLNFVGEFLVENTPQRCFDGRTLQRVWRPAQSL